MRLDGPESRNVEDRRGGGGGGFQMPGGRGGGIGLGGIAIVLIGLFFGVDLTGIVGGGDPGPQPAQRERAAREPGREDADRRFAAQVLGETEQVWTRQFSQNGRTYREPTLVLFSGATQSGCGYAQAQTGPFYCPADQRLYLDLDFMDQLQARLGARGDFARAYIIAHEVGHHVQNQLGILERAEQVRRRYGEGVEANQVQVRIELQADCLAGVWANQAQRARNILQDGDLEEGMNAAAAVGDDRLQRGRGTVQPETFTHGSSAQRTRWFRRGLQNGNLSECDTFGAQQL